MTQNEKSYKPIDQADIDYFISICGEKHTLIGEKINEDFSHDEMTPEELRRMPEVLIQISNTQEVSQIMAYCNKEQIPVTPRGQGTGL